MKTIIENTSRIYYFIIQKYIRSKTPVFEPFVLYIKQIKNEINRLYPNAEFIILVYEEDKEHDNWETIKNEGIRVINLNELTNENLKDKKWKVQLSGDNVHPNEKAWELIVPKLAEELNLN